jgi:GNAT superfamily N-acetyltransferase
MSDHECTGEKSCCAVASTMISQYSFWLYKDEKIESLNLFIRPIISRDIYDLKSFFTDCTIFQRASIDFSMYYYAFRPKYSYVIISKHGLLAHASIKQWDFHNHSSPSILMLGLVYVRSDYRKFGIGELLTNYVFKLKSHERNSIHANISTKHLPFYIRYGFQASFSLVGLVGKLSEFLHQTNINDDDLYLQLFESSDILDVATYDRQIYPIYRINYFEQLREHTYSIAGYVARSLKTNAILGYVILNFSQAFIKCGPLYAENLNIALLLLKQCAIDYDGMMLISLPEDNRIGIKMFESKHFKQTDILHRVYTGNENIFNGKTFERIWAITDDWLSLI